MQTAAGVLLVAEFWRNAIHNISVKLRDCNIFTALRTDLVTWTRRLFGDKAVGVCSLSLTCVWFQVNNAWSYTFTPAYAFDAWFVINQKDKFGFNFFKLFFFKWDWNYLPENPTAYEQKLFGWETLDISDLNTGRKWLTELLKVVIATEVVRNKGAGDNIWQEVTE